MLTAKEVPSDGPEVEDQVGVELNGCPHALPSALCPGSGLTVLSEGQRVGTSPPAAER